MRAALLIAVVVAVMAATTSCSGSTANDARKLDAKEVPKTIAVTSTAFADGASIPRANTCDGTGAAPTIAWGTVPEGTLSVAVVVDDPDAPSGSFLHWLVIGLPPEAGHVPSSAAGVDELDNAAGTKGWTPPCPPAGSTHHYRFSVYALRDYVCADNGDTAPGPDCSPPSSVQALPQIRDAAVAKGVLVGSYRR
jgi:Raf kinase inhibitor-like YbhB/YbcL family protein